MENFSISKTYPCQVRVLRQKILWQNHLKIISAKSSKVERKFIFTSSWQCFHSIGLKRFVMSSQSSLRFTHRHSSTGDENIMCWVSSDDMKDSSVWRGRLSTSQHIRERDIDTNSQQHCRANEAAESRGVWEVRKVLKNVNYKKLMYPSDSTNLSAYQMFCRRHRSLTHRENPEKSRDEKKKRRWNFIRRWKIIKTSKRAYHVTCYILRWSFDMRGGGKWIFHSFIS